VCVDCGRSQLGSAAGDGGVPGGERPGTSRHGDDAGLEPYRLREALPEVSSLACPSPTHSRTLQ